MVLAGRYLGSAPIGAKVDSSEEVAHLIGAVADLGCVSHPELPVVVPAPALHAPVVEEGTSVVLAN